MRVANMPFSRLLPGKGYQVRIIVPPELRQLVAEIRGKKPVGNLTEFTGTRDAREHAKRAPAVIAKFQALLEQARSLLVDGEVRHYLEYPDTTTVPEWATTCPANRATYERFGGLPRVVTRRGTEPPPLDPWWVWEANGFHRARYPDGDRPDGAPLDPEFIAQFKRFGNVAATAPSTGAGVVNFDYLTDLWCKRTAAGDRTVERRKTVLRELADFLGHDDASQVSAVEMVAYQERLIERYKSTTVRDTWIHITATFNFAFKQRKIATNPIAGLGYSAKTDPRDRGQPFSAEEQRLILTAARTAEPMIRWANWLAAYSGSRLAEIVEARAQDIEVVNAIPVFHSRLLHRPAKQKIKTAFSERPFPIHSAVLAEGFMEYHASLPETAPLFPGLKLDKYGRFNTFCSNRIMRWLRGLGITDSHKKFHSWRHTFKTLARDYHIEEQYADAICGHSNDRIGRTYGYYPIPTLLREIERLPNLAA